MENALHRPLPTRKPDAECGRMAMQTMPCGGLIIKRKQKFSCSWETSRPNIGIGIRILHYRYRRCPQNFIKQYSAWLAQLVSA